MPVLTRAILHRALSESGFLRPAQFRALGFDGPFKGWKSSLIGDHYSQEQLDNFVLLRKEKKNVRSDRDKLKSAIAKYKRENKYPPKQKGKKPKKKPPRKKDADSPKAVIPRTYNQELRDDRWIRKRDAILVRDGYKCISCGRSKYDGVKLNVHHLLYDKDIEMWDVPDWYLVTLCDGCHKAEHSKRLAPPRKHF